MVSIAGSISEGKLEPELNLARCLSCVQGTERGVSDIKIITNKVGMVEDVEEFRTELESITLFVSPILGQREVDVRDRLASHRAFTQRAELAGRWSGKRRRIQMLR